MSDKKVQIIYESKNKHNKKVAEGIAKKMNFPVADVKEGLVLENVDFLFIVGGWYDDSSNPELLSYIKNIKSGAVKHAALITVAHNYDMYQTFVAKLLREKNIDLVGERICPGRFLFFQIGHPNNGDINYMVEFIKEILGMPKY